MKALVFGCSFTAGAYEWRGHEHLLSHETWVKWLSKDTQYDVYAMPGGGLIQQARVIEELYQRNLLSDYRYVLIQTTYEPRLCFSKSYEYEKPLYLSKNINMHITGGKENGRVMYFTCPEDLEHYGIDMTPGAVGVEFATELYNSPTSQHIIDCCTALINDRCKRAGVPLYVFHYVENDVSFDNGIVLDIPYAIGEGSNTMGIWMNKKYQVLEKDFVGHYNAAGNKVIGQYVRKALDKALDKELNQLLSFYNDDGMLIRIPDEIFEKLTNNAEIETVLKGSRLL